jgi:hypothetical protein
MFKLPGGGLKNYNINSPMAAAAKKFPKQYQQVHTYSG